MNAIGSSSKDSRLKKNTDGVNAIGSSSKDSRLKTMRKELIQPAARSTDPAVGGGQQGASSGRRQATGHMFATTHDRAASRSKKFVCVGCRTKYLDQLESKSILVLRGILSFR